MDSHRLAEIFPLIGDGQRADLVEGLPIGRASALLNVGERTVARAREVSSNMVPRS